jgi:hypothetical protein
MPDIKLARLPDRTPVRVTVTMLPELHDALNAYARFYRDAYGKEEKTADLIPHMLAAYLELDRSFAVFRRTQGKA